MIMIPILILIVIVAAIMGPKLYEALTVRPLKMFERYNHHGKPEVWVRADLRGKHRDHCLCYDCKRFRPGTAKNCPIAQALYQACIDHHVVTPVWECRKFRQDQFAADRKWNQ